MHLATVHLLAGAGKSGFWKLLGFQDIILSKIRRSQEVLKKQHSEIHIVQRLGPGGRRGTPLVMKIWAGILLTSLPMLTQRCCHKSGGLTSGVAPGFRESGIAAEIQG